MRVSQLFIAGIVISLLVLPFWVKAHGGMMMDFDTLQPDRSIEIMESIEDKALNSAELHEEMENLMAKMMQGNLTDDEANRMVELMNKYPGVHNMMMNRMMIAMMNGPRGSGGFTNTDTMPYRPGALPGFMYFWSSIVMTFFLVWLVVGFLAIIFLYRKISRLKNVDKKYGEDNKER